MNSGYKQSNISTAKTKGVHFRKSIGTSADQIIATSTPCKMGVIVKSADANTGIVYVGTSSGVTAGGTAATDGFELGAGQSLTVPIDDANKVYIIASAASQNVYCFTV